MEDKGKGFSLRHKKSRRGAVADTPRQISHPIKADAQHAPSRRPARAQSKGDALNANTSDLVKRRYSTRFNNLPDFSNASAPPVPSIPAIPPQFTTPDYHPGTAWQKIPLDINALKNPDLSVEEYSKNFLSDASDQELRDHQAALRKLKEQASADLQHNVFQNRTQFIKISKEAEKLKSEMRVLRGLMAEVTTSLSQASINAGAPEPRAALDEGARIRARKQANRSSVANLEAMWSTQLQALWKNVEGSQKFLPAIPGRHIVLEQSTWIELDAATWKPGRKAHLFLLNDHLMVAQRRKRRIDPNVIANGDSAQKSSSRTVADKCWPLQDIDIIDLASVRGNNNEDMANAISIQYGKESCTYRSEKSSNTDKTNFLLHFRRTADELKRAFHADIEEQTSKSKETLNSLTSRDPSLTDKPELLKTLTSNTTRPDILIEVDGKHQNLRWVEGQIDELDSEVALQQFEDAVRRVEKLRRLTKGLKGNTIAQNLINTKVDERAKKLSGKISVLAMPITNLTNPRLRNTNPPPLNNS